MDDDSKVFQDLMNEIDKKIEKVTEKKRKLNELYLENPKKAVREARNYLNVQRTINQNEILAVEDQKKYFSLCIIAIILAGLGFFAEEWGLYIFAEVFFLAGFFIGAYVPIFGLIFLFSHGAVGYGLMLSTIIGKLVSSPVMQDQPKNITICLGAGLILIIFATILVIMHNLNAKLKEKSYFILIPFIIYVVVIILAILLSKNYETINTLKFF